MRQVFGTAFRCPGIQAVGRPGGKEYTLLTLVLMGALLSDRAGSVIKSIGMAAPLLVLLLRLIQGLALGGEYGGAVAYVAEHAPETKGVLYQLSDQTTATLDCLWRYRLWR